MNKKTTAIAVIGMACWYPGAPNPRQLWENILARRRQFRRTPDERLPISDYYDADPTAPDKTYGKWMAVIDGFEFDWAAKRIPKPTFESTDIVHWLALEMALEALADAGYPLDSVPSTQTGVVVGNTLTGEISRSFSLRLRWPYIAKSLRTAGQVLGMEASRVKVLESQMEEYYKQPLQAINQDSLAGFLSNTIAGRICNYLNLKGGGYIVDGACSSSLIAIATAARGLVEGDLDLALAGGVDISLDAFEMVGFAKTKALTSKEMAVYDIKASGFIPGEGCGFVVLKRLEDARQDGDYVYAVLRGWGISSDGAGVGITAPSASGQALALQRAYAKADYSPQKLDFIEGHGTGTPVGDRAELKGITLAMDETQKKRFCGITSLKSIIGHAKAAAGIGGFIKAVMAVNRRVLPPTAGCQEPNEVFESVATGLYPILQGECRHPTEILRAGVSAMGFGGSNCHVTLESGDAPSPRLEPALSESRLLVSHQETELFCLGADSLDNLQQRVEEIQAIATGLSIGEMVDLAADLAGKLDVDIPIRATVIAGRPDELVEHLQLLAQMLRETPPAAGETKVNLPQTVWLSKAKTECRVGFLFPGQGSQRLNMTRVLVERYSWAKELVQQADNWLQASGSQAVSPYIYRPLDRAGDRSQIQEWKTELSQTEIAQPAICLASLIWMGYLQKLGVEPVAVCGHSLGELTAFYATGAFDEKALLLLAALRGKAMSAPTRKAGVMASLGCSRQQAEALLASVKSDVAIANINSPTQVVISGSREGVEAVLELALEEGMQTRLLPVSNAFHSHFVAAAAAEVRQSAPIPKELELTNVPLFSSINGERVKAGLQLREHFGQQITAPVDFISLVEAISSECDILVEVGPGKVLSGLANSINGSDGIVCLPVESQEGKDRDMNTVLAAIFVSGGNINWDVLYENRLVRPLVWPRKFIVNPCEKPFQEITPPLVVAENGRESQLAAMANLSSQEFSNYLAQRGQFIAEVIKADLANWPGIKNDPVVAEEAEELEETGDSQISESASVEESIIAQIVRETGYNKESISESARLLEDLRLESIKAGEIIGVTATEFGVAGKIEPVALANGTIGEIAAAIRQAIADSESPSEESSKEKTWVRNFAVKYVPEALSGEKEVNWSKENCLIVCEPEETEIADRLCQSLGDRGARVRVMSFTESETNLGKYSQLMAILPRKAKSDILSVAGTEKILDRLQIFTRLPAVENRQQEEIAVTYMQFGGGYFGMSPTVVSMEQCCAKAISATLHQERPDLKVRIIDFAPEVKPALLAERVISELSTPESYTAVGYNGEMQRQIPRPVVQEPANYQKRGISWSGEDVILVTGGAKGITAECALELASATGVRMALVGSSPAPSQAGKDQGSEKIVRTLERYQAKGLTCRYYQCNVADIEAVENIVARVRQDMGEITGVIHGAAINRPSNLDKVSTAAALAEISPKLQGIINLCQVLEDKPPQLFVGLSSIIGFTGLQRNGWYGFSNEAMERILQGFGAEHPQTNVLSIAYSVWDEVGMGFEMGAVGHLRKIGIGAISKEEGVRRFLNLVQNDPGTSQVLVTGPMRTIATSAGFDSWLPQLLPWPRRTNLIELPGINEPGVEAVRRTHLTLESHPYLQDHLYKGSYLFPTVFGLEAMAQAVALVTGEDKFGAIRIEDIRLERGILVDPEKGTTIEVRAGVIERLSKEDPRRVKTEIRTENSGFAKAHFSATFVLDVEAEAPIERVEVPETPLDIQPQVDLYGPLLFQGPIFQRLQQFYSITGDRCIFSARQEYSDMWLLPDPYFRDGLLQAGQAAIPQDICLPIGIDSWEIYQANLIDSSLFTGVVVLNHREELEYNTTVFVVDESGRIVQKINGYRLRILEHLEDNPTAEELANPDRRDDSILQERLQEIDNNFGVKTPAVSIFNIPGLHQLAKGDRHRQEMPMLQQAIGKLLDNGSLPSENMQIEWLESGKPIIKGGETDNIEVSLSHDDRACLCVAGYGPQGCDMEPVKPRTEPEWVALLGNTRQPLMQELIDGGDSRERAGTRIWTAVEALLKAQHETKEINLAIDKWIGDMVLFRTDKAPHRVITFPVKMTRGQERLVAMVVQKNPPNPPLKRGLLKGETSPKSTTQAEE